MEPLFLTNLINYFHGVYLNNCSILFYKYFILLLIPTSTASLSLIIFGHKYIKKVENKIIAYIIYNYPLHRLLHMQAMRQFW